MQGNRICPGILNRGSALKKMGYLSTGRNKDPRMVERYLQIQQEQEAADGGVGGLELWKPDPSWEWRLQESSTRKGGLSCGSCGYRGDPILLEMTPETERGRENVPLVPSSHPPVPHRNLPLCKPNQRPEGKVNSLACDKNRAKEVQAKNLRAKKHLPLFNLIIKYWHIYLIIF